MNNKTISVVIPVKNEAKKIRACLEGIMNQTVLVKEIIVLDSGSTDGTLEILKGFPLVKTIHIPSAEFNHGETRNVGVRAASGDFVLMTVGDAVPVDNKWIENLMSGFDHDNVACVFGQQIVPHDLDKNPIEWYKPTNYDGIDRIYVGNIENYKVLSPEEKKNLCVNDDVTALYKRELLLEIPYQKVTFSEDTLWAQEALIKGYSIIYNSRAKVFHYHNTDYDFDFKRTFTVVYFRYVFFGFVTKTNRQYLFFLRILVRLFKEKRIPIRGKIRWFFYNLNQQRAIRRAIGLFNRILDKKPNELSAYHEKICGKPPIPIKNN